MKRQDISEARDSDLRGSLAAMQRAAMMAREKAIKTGTGIVMVRGGKTVRISAAQLRTEKIDLREDRKTLRKDSG